MANTPAEVLPGVYRIALPLPFELSEVNTYLVRLDDGWMLVDTGLATADSFDSLEKQLMLLAVRWRDIRQILVTHTHPDHVGQAQRLLELTGATLMMDEAEVKQLHLAAGNDGLGSPLKRAGVPDELIGRINSGFQKMRRQFPPLTPERVLGEGDIVETAMGPLRVMITPGHSSGHVCLWHAPTGTLFAADTLLEKITPNIGWIAGRDMLGEFFSSLDRVRPMDVERILPGHYGVFSGHREWIDATKRHHDERCDQIESALRVGPRTAHDLVSDLWTRPLAWFHHRFAVFEVLAHLEFLRRRERVSSELDVSSETGAERELWRV